MEIASGTRPLHNLFCAGASFRVNIRTLIADDEPLARQRIATLLQGDADIEVVGECAHGEEAVELVHSLKPDLLFLDVQMPVLDGFGVLDAVGDKLMPVTVFVTAYDRYAIRAFEVHAVDYLLKPFDDERFLKALERAKALVQRAGSGEPLGALLKEIRPERANAERLVVKSSGSVIFLRVDRIDWIEAAGNYLRLHVGTETHLLRETMNALEGRLDRDKFLRIHRSTMVNIERIKELQPGFHGEYVVILRDGTQLPLSRQHRRRLQEIFGGPL